MPAVVPFTVLYIQVIQLHLQFSTVLCIVFQSVQQCNLKCNREVQPFKSSTASRLQFPTYSNFLTARQPAALVCLYPIKNRACPTAASRLCWIQKGSKWGGLESCGRRLISSNGKTKGIAFFLQFFFAQKNIFLKCPNFLKKKGDFFRIFNYFSILNFETLLDVFNFFNVFFRVFYVDLWIFV